MVCVYRGEKGSGREGRRREKGKIPLSSTVYNSTSYNDLQEKKWDKFSISPP